MKTTSDDLMRAKKCLQLLFENWVQSQNVEGTAAVYRADVIYNKNIIKSVLNEKLREAKKKE